jgi:hypothetical protein
MATTLTVALIGDPKTALLGDGQTKLGLRDPKDYDVPYADRPKVDLEVGDDETLGSIMVRAAEHFNVQRGAWVGPDEGGPYDRVKGVAFVSFYTPEHHDRFRGWHSELPLVDDEGHLYFTYLWHDITFAQVGRAAEAGVFVGDPTKPYLILQPGIGNGLLVDWPTLQAIWSGFQFLIEQLDTLGGAYATKKLIIDKLRQRFGGAPPVIEKHASAWAERSARPDNVFNALGDGPWHGQDLADLLGVPASETEAFLAGAGWAQDGAGLWRRRQDEEAKFLNDTLDLIIHTGMTAERESVEQLVLDRAKKLVETGQAPPPLDLRKVIPHLPDDGIGFRDPNVVQGGYAIGRLRKTLWRVLYRFRGP